MSLLKATLMGKYRSAKSGNIVKRYVVTGSKDALAEYKEIQGTNYVADDKGRPLFFRSENDAQGKPYPTVMMIEPNYRRDGYEMAFDTSYDDAEFAASLPGAVGQAVAEEIAKDILARRRALRSGTSGIVAPTPAQENVAENIDDIINEEPQQKTEQKTPKPKKEQVSATPEDAGLGDI
jgi:hypothetical protein